MRLHTVGRLVAFFISALLCAPGAFAQDKGTDAKYKFRKGEVLKYDVTSHLDISLAGSDAAFLLNGNAHPLTWTVNGSFENKVIDVSEDGTANLERHVKSIDSNGHVENPGGTEKFKVVWSEAKDKSKPDESKYTSLMERFIVNMITEPAKYDVFADGRTNVGAMAHMSRLVMRRGMMMWPLGGNEMSWVSTEDIAVPVLHDKLTLEFKNTVTQDASRTGYKARIITAPVSIKGSTKTEGFGIEGTKFAASGQAKIEFDLTNGRLHKLELDLTIRLSGKGPVPGGGDGDIKGVVTYKETQVYKD